MLAKQLMSGKRTVGVYTPTPAPNTESAVTLTTTYCLKKANRSHNKFANSLFRALVFVELGFISEEDLEKGEENQL
jgi:hypothetical protein